MSARRHVVVMVAAMGTLVSLPAPEAPAATTPAPVVCPAADRAPADATVDELRQAVLCVVNQRRSENGLRTVVPNRRLAVAASRHSADMVQRRYFAHTSLGGTTFSARIHRARYIRPGRRWLVGETLAWASGPGATPGGIVDAWMNSPEHRRIILEGRFTDVGIGVAAGSPVASAAGAMTVTADFGHIG
jgi:uncharacterized protein YkwD